MPRRRPWLIAPCLLACAWVAKAQLLTTLFPEGVPGYGTEQGVTVKSRARPAFEPLGVHAGSLLVRPVLNFSVGYDDNIFGAPSGHGGWQIATRPSLLMSMENSIGSLGLFVSADDIRYIGDPTQNRTDGAVFVGATINIGRDKLTLGAGYLARHEDRTALDALPSDSPVAFTVENLRASYATAFGRVTATPSIEFNRWRFDNTTIHGLPVSQKSRDRTTLRGEMKLSYAWMPGRDFLFVTRVLDTHYDHPAVGAVSNNSLSWQGLFGIDYDDNSVWRYRLLGGVEYRAPASPLIAPQTTAIAEAEVTWSPSGMTTVRATATRGIEDAAQSGLSSYTYTTARVTLDHEYSRDILLNASAGVRQARFNQTGGQQLGYGLGAGATWLLNRNVRLSLTYDFADIRNEHLPAGTVAGDYTRSLTMLTLRMGL